MIPYRGNPRIEARLDRALDFLRQTREASAGNEEKPFYMDYRPWADAYLLRFLAAYVSSSEGDADKFDSLVSDAIQSLAKRQKPGGGWSYYVTHQLNQANRPSNQSISFMTAAITIALLESKEAGFDVSDKMLDRAVECLLRMRNSNDTFTYFLWHEHEDQGRLSEEEGAAGRGPLCALALYRSGRGSEKEVRDSLDLFLRYAKLYSRERGKSLMHAAPGGQGSHYLMFDYSWAAAATAALSPNAQADYRQPLLQLILTSRSEQGCFLDNPINGWHYGTGMALDALNTLDR